MVGYFEVSSSRKLFLFVDLKGEGEGTVIRIGVDVEDRVI